MIIYYLLQALQAVISGIGSVLPNASKLPTVGPLNLDTFFATGIGYVKFLAGIFPPLTTVIQCASIYLGYKLVMILIRLIFGNRTPTAEK